MYLYGASDALDAWRPVHSCDDALAPALPPDARVPSEDPSSACWMDDIIALANADAAAKRRAASTAAFLEHDEVTSPRTLAAPKTKPRAHPAAPAEAKPPRPVGVAAACRKFLGGAAAKKWANKLDGGDAESHPGSPRSASPSALAPKHHPRPKQQRNSSPLATPAKAEEPEPEPEPEPERRRRGARGGPFPLSPPASASAPRRLRLPFGRHRHHHHHHHHHTGTDEDSAKPCIETLARLGGDITSVCAALDAIDGFAAPRGRDAGGGLPGTPRASRPPAPRTRARPRTPTFPSPRRTNGGPATSGAPKNPPGAPRGSAPPRGGRSRSRRRRRPTRRIVARASGCPPGSSPPPRSARSSARSRASRP